MKPPTNYNAIIAAGGWNLSTAFLSAKAKAQARDSKGRFIPMGGMVRWLDVDKKWRWGWVTGNDGKDISVRENGKTTTAKIKPKQLEVVKALIPNSPHEAEQLKQAQAAAKKGDATPDIPTVKPEDLSPIDDADDEPALYVDTAGFKKVGGQSGSNPGGIYQGPNGEQFYIKKAQSEQHAANEVLAAKLYQAAGVGVPDVYLTEFEDGSPAVASRIVPDLKPLYPGGKTTPETLAEGRRGFAMDAWLANWDSIGLVYDNMMVTPDGEAVRVDTGGGLIYRAQGSPKGGLFGDTVGETETLRNPSMNAQAAKIFGGMGNQDISDDIADTVNKVSPEKIHELINELPFSSDAVKADLVQKLMNRKADLNTKFHVPAPPEPVKDEPKAVIPDTPGMTIHQGPVDPALAQYGPLATKNLDGTVNVMSMSLKKGDLVKVKGAHIIQLDDKWTSSKGVTGTYLTGNLKGSKFQQKSYKSNKWSVVPKDSDEAKAALEEFSKDVPATAPDATKTKNVAPSVSPALAKSSLNEELADQGMGYTADDPTIQDLIKQELIKNPEDGGLITIKPPSGSEITLPKHWAKTIVGFDSDADGVQSSQDENNTAKEAPGDGTAPAGGEDGGADVPGGTEDGAGTAPVGGPDGDGAPEEALPAVVNEHEFTPVKFTGVTLSSQFNPAEKNALSHYTGSGHSPLNAYLRTGKPSSGYTEAWLDGRTKQLDSALAKGTTNSDAILWRGFKTDAWLPKEPLQPGDEFEDKGFLSTSTDINTAKLFSGWQYHTEGSVHPTILELEVPAGSNAIDVKSHLPYGMQEEEFILPRGATLVAISDQFDAKGRRLVKAKLVPGTGHAAKPNGDAPSNGNGDEKPLPKPVWSMPQAKADEWWQKGILTAEEYKKETGHYPPGIGPDGKPVGDTPNTPPPPADPPVAKGGDDDLPHPAAKIGAKVASKKDGFSGKVIKTNPNSGYSLVQSDDGSKKLWRKWDTLEVVPDAQPEPEPKGVPVEIGDKTAAINKAVMKLGQTLPEGGDEVPAELDGLIDKLVADTELEPDEWSKLNSYFDTLQAEQNQETSDAIWAAWKQVQFEAGYDKPSKKPAAAKPEVWKDDVPPGGDVSPEFSKAAHELAQELAYWEPVDTEANIEGAKAALEDIENDNASMDSWIALADVVDDLYTPTDEDGGPGFALKEAVYDLMHATGIDPKEVDAAYAKWKNEKWADGQANATPDPWADPNAPKDPVADFILNGPDTDPPPAASLIEEIESNGLDPYNLGLSPEMDLEQLKDWLFNHESTFAEFDVVPQGPIKDAITVLAEELGVPLGSTANSGPGPEVVAPSQLQVGDKIMWGGGVVTVEGILPNTGGSASVHLAPENGDPHHFLTISEPVQAVDVKALKAPETPDAPETGKVITTTGGVGVGDVVVDANQLGGAPYTVNEVTPKGDMVQLTLEDSSGFDFTSDYTLDHPWQVLSKAATPTKPTAPEPDAPFIAKKGNELQVGDVILNGDGTPAYTILKTMGSPDPGDNWFQVETPDGEGDVAVWSNHENVNVATPKTPSADAGDDDGWVPTAPVDLKEGDKVKLADGDTGVVDMVTKSVVHPNSSYVSIELDNGEGFGDHFANDDTSKISKIADAPTAPEESSLEAAKLKAGDKVSYGDKTWTVKSVAPGTGSNAGMTVVDLGGGGQLFNNDYKFGKVEEPDAPQVQEFKAVPNSEIKVGDLIQPNSSHVNYAGKTYIVQKVSKKTSFNNIVTDYTITFVDKDEPSSVPLEQTYPAGAHNFKKLTSTPGASETPNGPTPTKVDDLQVGDVFTTQTGDWELVKKTPSTNGAYLLDLKPAKDGPASAPIEGVPYMGHIELNVIKKADAPAPPAATAYKVGDTPPASDYKPGMVLQVEGGGNKYKVNSVKPFTASQTGQQKVTLDLTEVDSGESFPSHTLPAHFSGWTLTEVPPTDGAQVKGSDLKIGDTVTIDGVTGKVESFGTNPFGPIVNVVDEAGEVEPYQTDEMFTLGGTVSAPETVSTPSAPEVPSGTLVHGSSHVYQDAKGRYVVNKGGHVLREGDLVKTKNNEVGKISKFELHAKYAKVKIDGKTKARQIDTLSPASGTGPAFVPGATPTPSATPSAPSAPAAPTPVTTAEALKTALSTGINPDGTWPTGTTFTNIGTTQTPKMKAGDIVGKDHQVVEWSADSTVLNGKQDVKFVGVDKPVTASKNNPWEIWEKDAPPLPPNESSVKKNLQSLKKNDYVKVDGKIETVEKVDQDLEGNVTVKFAGKPAKEYDADTQWDYFGNTKLHDPNPKADQPGDLIPGAIGKTTPDVWQPGDVVGDSAASKLTVESIFPSTTADGSTEVKFVGVPSTFHFPNDIPWTTWPKEDGQPLPSGKSDLEDVTPELDEPDVTPEAEPEPLPSPTVDPSAPYTFVSDNGNSVEVPVGWSVHPGSHYSGNQIYLTDGLDNWYSKTGDGELQKIGLVGYKKQNALGTVLFQHPGKIDVTPHIESVLTPEAKTEIQSKLKAYIEKSDGYYSYKDQFIALSKLLDDPSGNSLSPDEWTKALGGYSMPYMAEIPESTPGWTELGQEIVKLQKAKTGSYNNEWFSSQIGPQYHYDANERKALSALGLKADTINLVTTKYAPPASNKAAAAEIYAVASDPERAAIINKAFGAGTAESILKKTVGSNFKPALSGNGSPYATPVPKLPEVPGKGGSKIKLGDTVIASDGQGGTVVLVNPEDGRVRVRRADGSHFTRVGTKFSITEITPTSTGPAPAPSAPYLAKPRPPYQKPDWSTTLKGTSTPAQALAEVKKSNWAANHGYSFAADQDQIEDLDVHVSRILNQQGQELLELKFKVTPKHGKELHKRYSADPSWTSSFMQIEERSMSNGHQLAKLKGTYKVTSNHNDGWTMRHTTPDGAQVLLHQVAKAGTGPYAYHNMMQIRLPANATPEQITKAMYDAGIDKPGPADNVALKRFGENRLMSIFASQTNANTETLGSKREELLAQVQKDWGITWEDLEVHHGANGRIEVLFPQHIADKISAKTNVGAFHHSISGGTPRFIEMATNPHQGLLSTTVRWSEGVPYSGMSSGTDVGTGGGDYVFFHPKSSASSSGHGLVYDAKRLFRRSDFYANKNDKFGRRMTNVNVLGEIYPNAYETMFKHRASFDDALGYVVSPSERDSIIAQIKAKGITHIGGRTVEEFIVTSSNQFTPPPPLVVGPVGPVGGPAV